MNIAIHSIKNPRIGRAIMKSLMYDFFSEINRSRKSINQEIRILSRRADFDRGLRHEWVTGIYYLDIKIRQKDKKSP